MNQDKRLIDALASALRMGMGAYDSPEEFARALLERIDHEGYVIMPKLPEAA